MPPGAPIEAPKRRRLLMVTLVLGLVLVQVGGAAIGYVAWRQFSSDDTQEQPKYPDAWDPKVLPFVKIVQKQRGLKFKHPVYVDFLSATEFTQQFTSELDAEEKASLEKSQGILVATGLVAPSVDLLKEFNTLTGAGLIGAYSYEDERIRMRGKNLNEKAKATLVHELTHVLQDQHFDLSRTRGDEDEGQQSGLSTIIEGDADRIEKKYIGTLSKSEKAEVRRIEKKQFRAYQTASRKTPPVLKSLFESPYTLGEGLVYLAKALADDGDKAAIDDLLKHPPRSEEDLLDPFTLLVGKDKDIKVGVPGLDWNLERRLGDGTFGAQGWLLVLTQHLSAVEALTAVDGWGGDQYVTFERANLPCVRVDYRGDTKGDVSEMYDALTRWRAAAVGVPTTLERRGQGLLFAMCQAPRPSPVGASSFDEALGLALVRTGATVGSIGEGTSLTEARCFGVGVVREFSYAEILAENLPVEQLQALVASCSS